MEKDCERSYPSQKGKPECSDPQVASPVHWWIHNRSPTIFLLLSSLKSINLIDINWNFQKQNPQVNWKVGLIGSQSEKMQWEAGAVWVCWSCTLLSGPSVGFPLYYSQTPCGWLQQSWHKVPCLYLKVLLLKEQIHFPNRSCQILSCFFYFPVKPYSLLKNFLGLE